MNHNIPAENFLFLLAYAFGLDWRYLEGDVKETDFDKSTFLELYSFILTKWVKILTQRGLYRTFKKEVRETNRIRGRIMFEPTIKHYPFKKTSVVCQYDNLSFDILENQIILSTLIFCYTQLGMEKDTKKSGVKTHLDSELPKLIRLLSSAVNKVPLTGELFGKLTYHRTNIKYKPILKLCYLIYRSLGLQRYGDTSLFDLNEDEMNVIFESFLCNYLNEYLTDFGYQVSKQAVSDWVVGIDEPKTTYIPRIEPDIVIWDDKTPKLVIDAKFYKEPVYDAGSRYGSLKDDNYKTKSNNLYQILAYSNYYNCDGTLVYAQTEKGHFEEEVVINPTYYSNNNNTPRFKFGFYTLDLTGTLIQFQERMDLFSESVRERVSSSF